MGSLGRAGMGDPAEILWKFTGIQPVPSVFCKEEEETQ